MSGSPSGRDEEGSAMGATKTPQRPPFDPTALALGALFVVIAVVGLLDPGLARRVDLGVLIPATLVVVGSALLLGSAISGRRRGPGAPSSR